MNPIKQLIMWHINFLTPKLFGSLLGGLFGGDRPDAPTLESMTAKSAGTKGRYGIQSSCSIRAERQGLAQLP